jgi:hypothetical protein
MDTTTPEAGRRPPRREWIAISCVLLVGLFLSMLPHLLRWSQTGSAQWLCDTDELVPYGQILAHSSRMHPWKMGDPALPSGGASMYPWIQLGPWTLLANWTGVGPIGAFALMRFYAGLTVGLGLYLILRTPGRAMLGAALTVIVLSDHGFTSGIPFVKHWMSVVQIATGNPSEALNGWAGVMRQFRLITPGLSFLSLALVLFTLMRVRERPTTGRIWAAGLALGLCIVTYFFYWTTAVSAIGLLAILDRRSWKTYAAILVIGGIAGSPAVIQTSLIKAQYGSEWLARNEFMMPLLHPIHMLSKRALVLCVVAGFAVWRWNRTLLPLWAMQFCALGLSQSHELTRLYIQPWHWQDLSEMIGILNLAGIAGVLYERHLAQRRWAAVALWLLASAQFAGGTYLRAWSTDHNRDSARIERFRKEWMELSRTLPSEALQENSVIGGEIDMTQWAVLHRNVRSLTGATALSPSVNNRQWMERRMVNAHLKGLPEDQIEGSARGEYAALWESGSMTEAEFAAQPAAFRKLWQEIRADPKPYLDRFGVRYAVTRVGATPFNVDTGAWTVLSESAHWKLWERKP